MSFEAKIGQRVESLVNYGFGVVIGSKGTIADHHTWLPQIKWDNGHVSVAFNKAYLKLITMNDNDKIELTVADVKAAHAKGCSTGKAMVEAMFPKVFEKILDYNENKIYAFSSCGDIFKLHRIGDSWAFISMSDSICWGNGNFETAKKALASRNCMVFNNQREFINWCYSI